MGYSDQKKDIPQHVSLHERISNRVSIRNRRFSNRSCLFSDSGNRRHRPHPLQHLRRSLHRRATQESGMLFLPQGDVLEVRGELPHEPP